MAGRMLRFHCHSPRPCNARTRAGAPCRRTSFLGHWRCALHGALSSGPKTATGKFNTVRALQAGRQRWIERQKALVAAGVIKKLPCGRKPRGAPERSFDPTIRRAQIAWEKVMSQKNLPATVSVPWDQQTRGERLGTLAEMGMEVLHKLLEADINPNNHDPQNLRLLGIVRDAALGAIMATIRISDPKLQTDERSREQALAEIVRRIKAEEAPKVAAKPRDVTPRKKAAKKGKP